MLASLTTILLDVVFVTYKTLYVSAMKHIGSCQSLGGLSRRKGSCHDALEAVITLTITALWLAASLVNYRDSAYM